MRALSLRQPYTELILRGIETVEYRSRPTRIIGERFYIYATKKKWPVNTADNIVMPTELLPPWTLELANALKLFPHELPTGPASCCRPLASNSCRSDRRVAVHSDAFWLPQLPPHDMSPPRSAPCPIALVAKYWKVMPAALPHSFPEQP